MNSKLVLSQEEAAHPIPGEALTIINESGLEPSAATSLKATFADMFACAEEWKERAEKIVITDISQTKEMKAARAARLEIKALRVRAEKARKQLKEEIVRRGKAIDGVANVFKFLLAPIEDHLIAQEQFAERLREEQREALEASRQAELEPYRAVIGQSAGFRLADFDDEQWQMFLAGAKARHTEHLAEPKAAEDERLAREKAKAEARAAKAEAERVEREKMRAESERLRKELEEREKAQAAERERARKERQKAEALAVKERAAAEEKLRKEREIARREKEKAEAAKAEADRLRKAEEDRKREAEEAERKAAQAPDKQKLVIYAERLREAPQLPAKTKKGRAIASELKSRLNDLAAWVDKQAATL